MNLVSCLIFILVFLLFVFLMHLTKKSITYEFLERM